MEASVLDTTPHMQPSTHPAHLMDTEMDIDMDLDLGPEPEYEAFQLVSRESRPHLLDVITRACRAYKRLLAKIRKLNLHRYRMAQLKNKTPSWPMKNLSLRKCTFAASMS